MNRPVAARAPGKAVLIGEYAVLLGAPALAMAVDRHARVDIAPSAEARCVLAAPQLGIEPVGFRVRSDRRLAWNESAPGWPAVARTARMMEFLVRGQDLAPCRLTINTADLYLSTGEGPVKLGLGSSSAVTVALDGALQSWIRGEVEADRQQTLERLLKPYRQGQGGQGSGIDLAASLHGGVIGFVRRDEGVETRRLSLPQDLRLMFVWTGQPASTGGMLAAWQHWRCERPREAASVQAAMGDLCQAAQAAIDANDGAALARHFGDYGRVMGTMGGLMNEPVMTDSHARLQAGANRLGLAYKPCGAGAGDLGMVATTDPDRLQAMRRWLEAEQIAIVPLAVDHQGVQVRRSPDQD